MSLTVVGSIAFDAVTTPFGSRERMLGGSAVHFSLASSFFADVRAVGPGRRRLRRRRVRASCTSAASITDDIEHVAGRRDVLLARRTTSYDLNTAHTRRHAASTSSATSQPKLSDASRACDVLFLANIQPDLQREVREQCAQRAASSRWTR